MGGLAVLRIWILWIRPNLSATGTNQFYRKLESWSRDNFIASRQRQRDHEIEPQGPEKIRQKFWSLCLDGVATPNTV